MDKFDLSSADFQELSDFVEILDEKPFRAKQIFKWIHQKYVSAFSEMTDIPSQLREKLAQKSYITSALCEKKLISKSNNTIKYLFELGNLNIINNNVFIESVLMDYSHGLALCVSSQAGCKMGCRFCESGREGLFRNLTAGEISAQVYAAIKDRGRLSNITIMGCGEPLDNYENTLKFIKIINSEYGTNIGQRRITLSTCGITDKIYKLIDENPQFTLAVSLHAPNDKIRSNLMPIAKKYPLDELLEACKAFADKTKRRITFEYAMAKEINDSPQCAIELSKKLEKILCHVNLISVNSGISSKSAKIYESSEKTISEFKEILTRKGIETTIRRKLGSSLNAACGQLKHSVKPHI